MRRLCVVLIVLSLACSKQNDDDKLRKSIASWKATLRIVADARLKNEVRDGFVLNTIDGAIEDLEGQSAKTTKKRAEHLIGVAAKLRQAVERDDLPATAQARGELAR